MWRVAWQRPRRGAFYLGALVLLGPVAAAEPWTQLHGTAGRSGVLPTEDRILDIVARTQLLEGDEQIVSGAGPNAVQTLEGWVTVASRVGGRGCDIVQFHDAGLVAGRLPVPGCRTGYLQAYYPLLDAVLLCTTAHADAPVLRAIRLSDGKPLWSVVPARDFEHGLGNDTAAGLWWSCGTASLDPAEGMAYVPFFGTASGVDWIRHRIAKISLQDGRRVWDRAFRMDGSLTGSASGFPAATEAAPNFLPLGVTYVPSGLLVTGLAFSAPVQPGVPPSASSSQIDDASLTHAVVAWMSAGGDVRGFHWAAAEPAVSATSGATPYARSAAGSSAAAGRGVETAVALGDRLLVIRPDSTNIRQRAPLPEIGGYDKDSFAWAPVVWVSDRVYVPMLNGFAVFEDSNMVPLASASHSLKDHWLSDLVAGSSGSVYALYTSGDTSGSFTEGFTSRLFRFDPGTGAVAQDWRMPAHVRIVADDGSWPLDRASAAAVRWRKFPSILPNGPNGLAVLDPAGNYFILGDALPAFRPPFSVSSEYPAPREPMELIIHAQALPLEVSEWIVRWGDGQQDRIAGGDASLGRIRINHTYVTNAAVARFQILVTAQFTGENAGGRTGTSAMMVEVGGRPPPVAEPLAAAPPPPEPTFLERAFARDNLDTTWGMIGVWLAAMGAIIAWLARSQSRSVIARELRKLEAIRERARTDPPGAMALLQRRRAHLRGLLLRGAIEHGAFNLLWDELRRENLRILRLALAEEGIGLPDEFRERLDRVLEDGVVSGGERVELHDLLRGRTGVSAPKRAKLMNLLDSAMAF